MRLQFDFAGPDGRPAPVVFRDPVRVITARTLDEVAPAFRDAEAALATGRYVAGLVSYEAAPAFDASLVTQPPTPFPLVWFGVFDSPAPADGADLRVPASNVGADLQVPASDVGADLQVRAPRWTPALSAAAHAAAVRQIREAIADGDTYQINYTFRLDADLGDGPLDVAAWYRVLAASERVPFGAWLDLGDWQVLSLSPELFFRLDGGRIITQPMKGTAPRGRWREEDDAHAAALAASEKNRAENVMIVDLMRNDLTRVCETGSVVAPALFHVDRYGSVLQMISTVEGRVREGVTLGAVFRALFPAGSITGAPKSSSMRLIAALEHAPRGVYCGAIGYAAPGGDAVFNVAIRTATFDRLRRAAVYGVGGGITWDSDAGDEHAEALSKAACLTPRPAFGLIETFRAEDGRAIRFDRHVTRLAASARFFGWPCDAVAVAHAVAEHLSAHPSGVRRVRLELAPSGQVRIESRAADPAPEGPVRVVLADAPVDRRDLWLCHKTTRRAVYDAATAAHPDAFDVLLWNAEGELTEFTRANVVLELDGHLVTPPRECGLLAGVLRDELLEAGEITTRILRREDLARASQVFWVNSLRGRLRVHLVHYLRRWATT